MGTQNICFCGEIRKMSIFFSLKHNALSGTMDFPRDILVIIRKTRLFKYIENFTTKKMKIFR